MRAVLSDDHNYERGLATLHDIVDHVVRDKGAAGLRDFAVALSLGLAAALERIAHDQGLPAADLVDVWFAEWDPRGSLARTTVARGRAVRGASAAADAPCRGSVLENAVSRDACSYA